MKTKLIVSTGFVLFLFGCSTTPKQWESSFMNIETNRVPVVIVSNGVPILSEAEVYRQTPGAGAQEVQRIGTEIGNLFGVGGLVGTGLGALFSIYGMVRSNSRYRTAANLAQSIETAREFIRNLPNGQQYDSAFVSWLQKHQTEGNVIGDVVTLIQSQVSNPDAQVAARDIQNTLSVLQGLTENKPKTKV